MMLSVSSPLASAAERGATKRRLRTTLLPRRSSQVVKPAQAGALTTPLPESCRAASSARIASRALAPLRGGRRRHNGLEPGDVGKLLRALPRVGARHPGGQARRPAGQPHFARPEAQASGSPALAGRRPASPETPA